MKSEMSLSSLLLGLLKKTPPTPPVAENEETGKLGTTIRLEPRVKRFYEARAEQLGNVSLQDVIAMTLKAVMSATEEPQATEPELMADRFIELFTGHGIAIVDIPDILPTGAMERADLLSRADLVNKLNAETIRYVADLFTVDEEWIKGQSRGPQRKPFRRWYKNVNGFARRLAELEHNYSNVHVYFIGDTGLTLEKLKEATENDSSGREVPIGVVIEKTVTVNRLSFQTYEVWESERWNYSKCRYDLKYMMRFCERAHISYTGVLINPDQRQRLFGGEELACTVFRRPKTPWHPDTLLWNDERNPERHELQTINECYAESGAQEIEVAVREGSRIDWEMFRRGEITFKDGH